MRWTDVEMRSESPTEIPIIRYAVCTVSPIYIYIYCTLQYVGGESFRVISDK